MNYSEDTDSVSSTESSAELSINDILLNKGSLSNWNNRNAICDAIKYKTYNFTNTDFNNFIIAATNGKSNSFIRKKHSPKTREDVIINYMFTNFSPNDKQLKLITSCYKTKIYNRGFLWLDALIKRDYIFTNTQLDLINDINYPGINKLFNNKEITVETFKYYGTMISNCEIEKNDIEKIKNYTGKFATEYLELLFASSYFGEAEETFIIEVINKTININESIYQIIIDKNITNYNIINCLISNNKCKPSNEFVKYLTESTILTKRLQLLFHIMELGVQIDEKMLNNMIQQNYCKYDPTTDIDFNKLNINFDEFINLNLNIAFQNTKNTKNTKNNKNTKNTKNTKNNKKKYVSSSTSSEEEKRIMPQKYLQYYKKYNAKNDEEESNSFSTESSDDMIYDDETCIKIYTIDLFKLLGIQPTIETLKIICKKGSVNVFDRFVTTYKIIPNKECLDESMLSLNQEMIFKIICYKINPDKDTFNKMFKCKTGYFNPRKYQEITELLIKNGLQITFNELEMLIMRHSYIDNLERFGINYDEKLYFICYKYDCCPKSYEDKFTINSNTLELRKMCEKTIKLDQFTKFLKNKNVKPDKYCVDNIYINGNRILIDYLTNKLKCYPSILVFLKTSKYSDIVDCKWEQLNNQLNITHHEMSQTFDHIDLNNL